MSDENVMNQFIRIEKLFRIMYIIYFVEGLIWFWIVWVKGIVTFDSRWNNIHNTAISIIQMYFLVQGYRKITKSMKQYHLFRYHKIEKNLKTFFWIVFINTIINFIISSTIGYVKFKDYGLESAYVSVCWGYLYPTLLCYMVVFFKSSKDPL